jgi:hypothetical protein
MCTDKMKFAVAGMQKKRAEKEQKRKLAEQASSSGGPQTKKAKPDSTPL